MQRLHPLVTSNTEFKNNFTFSLRLKVFIISEIQEKVRTQLEISIIALAPEETEFIKTHIFNYAKYNFVRFTKEDFVEEIAKNQNLKIKEEQYKNNALNYSPEGVTEPISQEKALTIEPKNFEAVYLIYNTNGYFMINDWSNGDLYYDQTDKGCKKLPDR